jgi:hypothetical protein
VSENTKWVMGGLAVIAAFLLAQSDVVVPELAKVALGAFLAFAAYASPSAVGARMGAALSGLRK